MLTSFNLTTEPWIPVVLRDRSQVTVSLIELIESWGDFLEINAENPPTTFAIYRLVLAILHSAYGGPVDPQDWRKIWRDNGVEAIAYLKKWSDRFDLLHPEYPFMQDVSLPIESPAPFYSVLDFQPDATPAHFSALHRFSGYQPDAAAIARGIVRCQTMDLAGLKSGYPGLTGRSAVAPPTINAANVLVQGGSLRETLALNLVDYQAVEGDRPAWEYHGYAGMPLKGITPTGLLHYLTFPWRRVHWVPQRGIVLSVGDTLAPDFEVRTLEPAIAYRYDEKNGYRPVRFSLTRAAWRDAHAFLRSTDEGTRPRVLDWVARLAEEGLVQEPLNIAVMAWSADKAKSLGWRIETLGLPIQLLRDESAWQTLRIAIQWANACEQIFRSFRGSPYGRLAEALHHPDAATLAGSFGGAQIYWADLQTRVPELIRAIALNPTNRAVELEAWKAHVQTVAFSAFKGSIARVQDYHAKATALNSATYWLYRKLPEDNNAQEPGTGDSVS